MRSWTSLLVLLALAADSTFARNDRNPRSQERMKKAIRTRRQSHGLAKRQSPSLSLVQNWQGSDLLNSWDYMTGADPTRGNVTYVSVADAQTAGLVSVEANNTFRMAVSTGDIDETTRTRQSVRLSSRNHWKKGQLLVASVSHLPEGCGTWPALWALSATNYANWPVGGEIDIIEGINNIPPNSYVMHTSSGCDMKPKSGLNGKFITGDCSSIDGCRYTDSRQNSFGPDFNQAGGGVYASYFSDDGIKMWFWSNGDVPASILSGSPSIDDLGTPSADFGNENCDISEAFDDEQMIIINTTLFGDWAGQQFSKSGCPASAEDTLEDSSNFEDAYWLIDYIKLYG